MQVDFKLLGVPRHLWDPNVGPGDLEGCHSDHPTESPSEPASPPHSDAMGSAGLARGVGVAADFGLPEEMGLMGVDEGLDEELRLAQGKQRQLPQVVWNRRR